MNLLYRSGDAQMLIRAQAKAERERIVSDPGSSLRSFAYRLDHFPFHLHHHPEIELTLIERGAGVRTVGAVTEAYGPGDVVLVGGDVPHSWASQPGAGGVRSVVIQFPADLLGRVPEARTLQAALERSRLGLAGPSDAAALVRAVHEASDPLLRLGRLLEAVAASVTWRPISPLPPRRRRRDPRLERAVAWLHQHATEPIELGMLAARVDMAPPALSRSFRSAFGITAAEYLARLRIGLCCRDLAGGDDEVAAIAFANGFGNLASFHRWFRRVTATTPERWRDAIDGAGGDGG